MQFSPEDAERLMAIMRWRRDVRHFRSDPLPAETVARLRAALDVAPSVGNARPWRVIEVVDPELRRSVRDNFEAANRDAAGGYSGAEREAYDALKLAGIDRAPLQLAVFTETDPAAGRGLGRRTMPETLAYSTVMAIYGLWLVARTLNVGVGWVSILDPEAMARLFAVPAGWRFTGYLCIGYPAPEGEGPGDSDTPLLHETGWQENRATHWERR